MTAYLCAESAASTSQGDITLLIVFVLLALGVSFLCSVLEAVLLSLTPAYIAAKQAEAPAVGARLAALKDDVDRPLAAILSLNTIAHTAGAAGAGAQAAEIFGSESIGIVSAIMTILILIGSEIIPKTLGAAYWRQLGPSVARVLGVLIISMLPLVWIARWITRALSHETKPKISREEIQALASLGAAQGVLEENESRIFENLPKFRVLRARDVMTPRTVMVSIPQDTTVAEFIDSHADVERTVFSRLPLTGTSVDDVTGYVLVSDILRAGLRGERERPLSDFQRDLLAVPAQVHLPAVFERILRHGAQIALVVDEYGGTAGLVTLEDVVETILGMEIVDEVDAVHDMQELARAQWSKRASRLGIKLAAEPHSEEQPKPPAAPAPTTDDSD